MKHFLFTFAAAAILGKAQAQVPSYVPTDGLVAWYPFNGDAHDESGNGNDAIESANANLMPSFTYDSHWNREVIEFDDVDDELTVLAPNQLGVGNEFSFSTWLVPNDQNHGQVMSMDAGRFSFFLHGADDHFDAISGTSWASEAYYCGWNNHPYVHPEGWFHMTITVSADSIKAFGNGQLIAVKDCGGQSTFDTNIIFGFRNMNSSGDYHWGGRLADCGMWNRALLPGEIAAMYQSEENPSIPGCMDEAACNFNPEATEDDGSCDYCECVSPVVFGGNWNDVLVSYGTNQLYTTWEDLDLSPIQGRGIRKIVGGEGYFLTLMEDSTVVTLCENCLYGNPPPSTWKVKDVEAGRHEGVLVRADGSLYSFGANYAGLSSEPIVNNAVQCAAASWFHMALLEDGEIVGWGDAWEPCPLELEDVIKIDASGDHAVALLESGKLVEWGRLGDGTVATSKDWILELNNVIDAIAGQSSTWIIFNDGSATRVSFPDGDIMMELPASSTTISGTGNWFSVSGHMNANGDVFVQKGGTQIDTTLDLSVYASCDVCIADTDGDGVCNDEELFGCTDEMGCNYIPGATQNANCIYPFLNAQDCMDGAGACGEGTHWDVASQTCVVTNPSDSNFDGCVQLSDLLDLLGAYGTCEWQCGDPMSYQGYDYETVLIGEQCWFAENARYMPFVGGGFQSETPSISVYGYSGSSISEAKSTNNYISFGALYNFVAVEEIAICPTGWHVPTKEEFDMLFQELGGLEVAHLSMMAMENWNLDFVSTDLGFNVLPAGWLYNSFQSLEEAAFIWTSSSYGENDPRRFEWNIQPENNFIITYEGASQAAGKSVRCLKDAE